jgi:hypothetical protein
MRTDVQIDMRKQTVAFRNFVNAPTKLAFLDQLSDYELLNKDSPPRSWLCSAVLSES